MTGIPSALFDDTIAWFADWPDDDIPRTGALVYTIWDRSGRFLYVGMSGRGVKADSPKASGHGPWGRLNSHASGRRSGDQFCIYVCDRLVLPRLGNRIAEVADGALSLDAETRTFIRQELGYRWCAMETGAHALAIERFIQAGCGPAGLPMLNPRAAKS
jgi:hypothetical protein